MSDKSTASSQRNLSVALRPQNFDEFIGNRNIIGQVRSQLDSGRIPTAFLLSGSTGCGKTTLARCINTALQGELVEKNAADDTGVDAARWLGDASSYRPLSGDYKVIVLDEAHQLTKQAQNALLKHVEDAPPSTVWIFCTTEPSRIIPTLRGRCISFTLGTLKGEEVGLLVRRGLNFLDWKGANEKVDTFVTVLVQEGVSAPRAILMAVERYAGGMDSLGSIYSSTEAPGAFQIAQAAAKRDWIRIRQALSEAQADEAIAIRIVVVNYLKSMLFKGNDAWIAPAIKQLTENVPAIEPLGLANLSAILYDICYLNSNRR